MTIQKVYTTSKGTFWSREDAEKKCNRAVLYGSRPGDSTEREKVRESYILIDEDHNVFALTKVDVQ